VLHHRKYIKVNRKWFWVIFFHITSVLGYHVPPGYKIAQYMINLLFVGYKRISLIRLAY